MPRNSEKSPILLGIFTLTLAFQLKILSSIVVVSVFKLKILIKKKFLSSSDAKNDSNSWRMDFQPFSFLIDGGKQSELFFG